MRRRSEFCDYMDNCFEKDLEIYGVDYVLEKAYALIEAEFPVYSRREISCQNVIFFLWEITEPSVKENMINNCMSEPYSKWFVAMFEAMRNYVEYGVPKTYDRKQNLKETRKVFHKVIKQNYSKDEIVEFFLGLVMNYEDELDLRFEIGEFMRWFFGKFCEEPYQAENRILWQKIYFKLFERSKYRLAATVALYLTWTGMPDEQEIYHTLDKWKEQLSVESEFTVSKEKQLEEIADYRKRCDEGLKKYFLF